MKYATIEDISRKVNKSVATVSRVLNGKESEGIPISNKTRDMILAAARELNYTPNYLARNLVQNNSKVIGLVIPDIMQSFFNEVCYYLSRELDKQSYDILLAHSYEDPACERQSIEMLLSRRVNGILIAPAMGLHNVSELIQIRESRIPLILLDRYFPGESFYSVTTDDVSGSYELVDHLIHQGARRILFIAGNRETSVSVERIEGYVKALKNSKCDPDDTLIVESGYFMEDGYEITGRLYRQGVLENVDAILGVNDAVALGAMKALDERGIRIPRDMLVAGYANDRYSDFFKVPLTTVKQPKDIIANRAVKMLMRLIKGETVKERCVRVPCEMIKRKSTCIEEG